MIEIENVAFTIDIYVKCDINLFIDSMGTSGSRSDRKQEIAQLILNPLTDL